MRGTHPGRVGQRHTGGGGCAPNSGEAKAGEVRYDASDVEVSSVQYVHGNGTIVHELATNGTTTVQRYRHEDASLRRLPDTA